jgi:hypothetical protein
VCVKFLRQAAGGVTPQDERNAECRRNAGRTQDDSGVVTQFGLKIDSSTP